MALLLILAPVRDWRRWRRLCRRVWALYGRLQVLCPRMRLGLISGLLLFNRVSGMKTCDDDDLIFDVIELIIWNCKGSHCWSGLYCTSLDVELFLFRTAGYVPVSCSSWALPWRYWYWYSWNTSWYGEWLKVRSRRWRSCQALIPDAVKDKAWHFCKISNYPSCANHLVIFSTKSTPHVSGRHYWSRSLRYTGWYFVSWICPPSIRQGYGSHMISVGILWSHSFLSTLGEELLEAFSSSTKKRWWSACLPIVSILSSCGLVLHPTRPRHQRCRFEVSLLFSSSIHNPENWQVLECS